MNECLLMLTSVEALTFLCAISQDIFMQKEIPMSDTYLYTEQYGVRVEPELKTKIRSLRARGVDTPKLIREAIRLAVEAAEAVTDKAG